MRTARNPQGSGASAAARAPCRIGTPLADVPAARAGEEVEALVVVDLPVAEHAAVAVGCVFAEADVREEEQVREPIAKRAELAACLGDLSEPKDLRIYVRGMGTIM